MRNDMSRRKSCKDLKCRKIGPRGRVLGGTGGGGDDGDSTILVSEVIALGYTLGTIVLEDDTDEAEIDSRLVLPSVLPLIPSPVRASPVCEYVLPSSASSSLFSFLKSGVENFKPNRGLLNALLESGGDLKPVW